MTWSAPSRQPGLRYYRRFSCWVLLTAGLAYESALDQMEKTSAVRARCGGSGAERPLGLMSIGPWAPSEAEFQWAPRPVLSSIRRSGQRGGPEYAAAQARGRTNGLLYLAEEGPNFLEASPEK